MGGRTWRLMHQGHSRGCAFLQFFLCLWGVSPAVSASVSQFGQHGAIVARGKPPLRPFGACFGRVGRLVLAASRQKGWARTMGRVLEQLSARQVLLTRSMCVGGLGAQSQRHVQTGDFGIPVNATHQVGNIRHKPPPSVLDMTPSHHVIMKADVLNFFLSYF